MGREFYSAGVWPVLPRCRRAAAAALPRPLLRSCLTQARSTCRLGRQAWLSSSTHTCVHPASAGEGEVAT